MPHIPDIKSAKKRARTALKRQERNKAVKSKVRTFVRKFEEAEGPEALVAAYNNAARELDKAANKGVIHPNKAARTKSRLTKRIAKATGTA